MKHIQKRGEPEDFTRWKNPSRTWEKFQKKTRIRRLVKSSLLEEQFYLCCYCEQGLEKEDDTLEPLSDSELFDDTETNEHSFEFEKSHIEHFRPRRDPAVDPLSYDNLLCSCLKDWPSNIPLHCGALKGRWFDPLLLISPLDLTCETRFLYSAEGDILPADENDQAAGITIEKLGLNIPKLKAKRAAAIDPFTDASLSLEELKILVDDYLQETNGRLNQFWTTIKYLFA